MSDRDQHRAERDAEILYWLGKKALEYRATGRKQDLARADVIAEMASKISRGAVRTNNTLLPEGVTASFFQPGHTYTDPAPAYDWQFRCDTVTVHPDTGERVALGWRRHHGEWEPYAYDEADYSINQLAGTTVSPTEGGDRRG
jgi:hypothetical protein